MGLVALQNVFMREGDIMIELQLEPVIQYGSLQLWEISESTTLNRYQQQRTYSI
jgi:hypothetical protein